LVSNFFKPATTAGFAFKDLQEASVLHGICFTIASQWFLKCFKMVKPEAPEALTTLGRHYKSM